MEYLVARKIAGSGRYHALDGAAGPRRFRGQDEARAELHRMAKAHSENVDRLLTRMTWAEIEDRNLFSGEIDYYIIEADPIGARAHGRSDHGATRQYIPLGLVPQWHRVVAAIVV